MGNELRALVEWGVPGTWGGAPLPTSPARGGGVNAGSRASGAAHEPAQRPLRAGEEDSAKKGINYSLPTPWGGLGRGLPYSTVTLFARLRGWSTSVPLSTATW
jgi:hypothetical protein